MSTYLIWFLVGVCFLTAEFSMPVFIMFFFAIGAGIVSLITIYFNLSINSQIILFALSSVLSLILLRNYMKSIFKGTESEDKGFDNSLDSNKKNAIVSKAIKKNSLGEIRYKGTFYKAQSDSFIDEGKNVKIVNKGDKQGSFYIVEEI